MYGGVGAVEPRGSPLSRLPGTPAGLGALDSRSLCTSDRRGTTKPRYGTWESAAAGFPAGQSTLPRVDMRRRHRRILADRNSNELTRVP
jgi:hypothetical protein